MTKALFLGMRGGWEGATGQVLRDAAARMGISLAFMFPQEGKPSEIERVLTAIEQQRPDGVLVSGEGDLYANRQLIAELAVSALASSPAWRGHAETPLVSCSLNIA